MPCSSADAQHRHAASPAAAKSTGMGSASIAAIPVQMNDTTQAAFSAIHRFHVTHVVTSRASQPVPARVRRVGLCFVGRFPTAKESTKRSTSKCGTQFSWATPKLSCHMKSCRSIFSLRLICLSVQCSSSVSHPQPPDRSQHWVFCGC